MIGGRFEAWFRVPSGVSVSATNGAGGPTSVSLTAGAYTLGALLAHLQARLIAVRPPSSGSWVVSYSTGASGDGRVTIHCTQSSGAWSIAWTSTALRDLLGFAGDLTAVSTAQTGAAHARGLWLPKCPLALDGHPSMAPEVTDLRLMQTPDGRNFGHRGTSKLVHKNLVYSHVPLTQYREAAAPYAGGSWEAWLADTQWGSGHAWFTPASKVKIWWPSPSGDAEVGVDKLVRGWYLQGVEGVKAPLAAAPWTALYRVEIPMITASPADVGA